MTIWEIIVCILCKGAGKMEDFWHYCNTVNVKTVFRIDWEKTFSQPVVVASKYEPAVKVKFFFVALYR